MSRKKQGFASFTKEKHREVSSRGGKAKVPKGTATLSPEERIKRASNAGKARWEKVRAERVKGRSLTSNGTDGLGDNEG